MVRHRGCLTSPGGAGACSTPPRRPAGPGRRRSSCAQRRALWLARRTQPASSATGLEALSGGRSGPWPGAGRALRLDMGWRHGRGSGVVHVTPVARRPMTMATAFADRRCGRPRAVAARARRVHGVVPPVTARRDRRRRAVRPARTRWRVVPGGRKLRSVARPPRAARRARQRRRGRADERQGPPPPHLAPHLVLDGASSPRPRRSGRAARDRVRPRRRQARAGRGGRRDPRARAGSPRPGRRGAAALPRRRGTTLSATVAAGIGLVVGATEPTSSAAMATTTSMMAPPASTRLSLGNNDG